MTVTTTALRTTTVMSTSPVVRPTTVTHTSSYKSTSVIVKSTSTTHIKSTSTTHVKSPSTNDGKTSSKPFVSTITVKSSVVNSASTKYSIKSTANAFVTNKPNKGDDESSDENHVGVMIGSIIGGLLFLIILVSIASVIAWQCG